MLGVLLLVVGFLTCLGVVFVVVFCFWWVVWGFVVVVGCVLDHVG